MWGNPGLTKSLYSTNPISPYTIVKFDTVENTVITATAATDLSIGVTNEIGFSATDVTNGAMVDVIMDEVAQVSLGGAVTRGQKLTSNASGQAVVAAPAAGANVQIIGFALKSGVAGDIIPIYLIQSVMQG